MMEDGLIALVQSDTAVLALCPAGGFLATLPKGTPLPSWSYLVVSNVSGYGLTTKPGLNTNRVQIDCYGAAEGRGVDCIQLAKAIDAVLSGFYGVLPDPDQTLCQGCFQSNVRDFFDDAGRTYRRMLEYEICFTQ